MPFKARSNDQNKLIVVGIAKNVDDAALSDMFGLYGTVAEAKVVLDDKKQSRGFGFVTYTSSAAKNKAIKHMNQTTVDGRVLNVRDVVPKADREAELKKEEKNKTGICWAFQKGLCDKGDACKYPHEVKDGEYGSCFEFVQMGKCKRGDECKFAHTGAPKQMKNTEATKPTKAKEDQPSEANKPRVCFAFQNGKCHRGKSCMFVHERLEQENNTDSKKRKRDDDQDLEAQLGLLVKAEEEALKVYESAKKERIACEQKLKATNKKEDKPDQSSKKEKSIVDTKAKTKEVKTLAAPRQKVDEFVDKEDSDNEDSDGPSNQFEAKSFDDDDDEEDISSIIQQAVHKMKKADEDIEAKDEPASLKGKKKTKQTTKPATTKKSNNSKHIPDNDDVDMGAAFDDDEPPKKKSKLAASRMKISEERRIRSQKKKEALKRLREKKVIEVVHE